MKSVDVDKEDLITDNGNIKPIDDCNTCEVCATSFSTKAFLKQHRLIYKHLKVLPCLICQKTFSTTGNSKQHKLVHTGEKPHQVVRRHSL